MNDFLRGAITMGSFSIAVFFLRFWRTTHDRLFLLFSAAFCLLGLNWTLATVAPALALHAYMFRFLAFVLIAVGVLDKNRRKDGRQ